jgi:FAD/FMN-containing dehydrogenase
VHGKNHHRRGTLGQHVRRLGLLRSDAGRIDCSPQERFDLYAATIGGLGLTGLIEWAEIQLIPIRSSQITCVTQRFDDLDGFFALSAELDDTHEYCVSWVDCMARGSSLGRGIYSAANFTERGELAVQASGKLAVPFTPPFSFVNRLSLPVFNTAYWRKASARRRSENVGYDSFFYPLDGVLEWNRLYGPKGFQQYQAVVPECDARDAIRSLLDTIASSATGSFLAVLKRCGEASSPGLMSFPCAGTSLAIDFPQTEDLERKLFPRLDAIVREAGGRLYPAKDAHMRADDFKRSYPRWSDVEALRDPALMSRFWRRVTQ